MTFELAVSIFIVIVCLVGMWRGHRRSAAVRDQIRADIRRLNEETEKLRKELE